MFDRYKQLSSKVSARFEALPKAGKALAVSGAVLVVVVVMCATCASAINSGQVVATHTPSGNSGQTDPKTGGSNPLPTQTSKPVGPLLKDTGNGDKKTASFHVDGDWKLTYNCKNTSKYVGETTLFITVYNTDGSYDSNITQTCKHAYGGDQSIEHDPLGGDKYLDISAYDTTWDVTVEDM